MLWKKNAKVSYNFESLSFRFNLQLTNYFYAHYCIWSSQDHCKIAKPVLILFSVISFYKWEDCNLKHIKQCV